MGQLLFSQPSCTWPAGNSSMNVWQTWQQPAFGVHEWCAPCIKFGGITLLISDRNQTQHFRIIIKPHMKNNGLHLVVMEICSVDLSKNIAVVIFESWLFLVFVQVPKVGTFCYRYWQMSKIVVVLTWTRHVLCKRNWVCFPKLWIRNDLFLLSSTLSSGLKRISWRLFCISELFFSDFLFPRLYSLCSNEIYNKGVPPLCS